MVTLFRSLTVAFVAVVVVLALMPAAARRPAAAPHLRAPSPCMAVVSPRGYAPAAPPVVSVIDVAPGISPASILSLVHLAPTEHVIAIDDRAVANDLQAGAVLGSLRARANGFVDLTVASADAQRRVLVLMH